MRQPWSVSKAQLLSKSCKMIPKPAGGHGSVYDLFNIGIYIYCMYIWYICFCLIFCPLLLRFFWSERKKKWRGWSGLHCVFYRGGIVFYVVAIALNVKFKSLEAYHCHMKTEKLVTGNMLKAWYHSRFNPLSSSASILVIRAQGAEDQLHTDISAVLRHFGEVRHGRIVDALAGCAVDDEPQRNPRGFTKNNRNSSECGRYLGVVSFIVKYKPPSPIHVCGQKKINLFERRQRADEASWRLKNENKISQKRNWNMFNKSKRLRDEN